MLTDVRDALTFALANGTDFNTFKKQLKPYLMERGWWGEQVMIDPKDGKEKLVQLGSTRRLETIFDTNIATARAAGQWERIQAGKASLPYLRYNPSHSQHKRDAHTRYYGLVRPVDDVVWQKIYPPNGYGCQCSVSQLTRQQAEDIGISDPVELDEVEVINSRTGEVVYVPKGITPSFAHNHSNRLGAIEMLIENKDNKAFLDEVRKQRDSYLLDRFEKPAFLGNTPALTAIGDVTNLAQIQAKIYSYAGSGYQVGKIPLGKTNSMEIVENDGEIYLLKYLDKGVKFKKNSEKSKVKLKEKAINKLCREILNKDLNIKQISKVKMENVDIADKITAYLYTTNKGYQFINPSLIKHKGDIRKLSDTELQFTRALDEFLRKAPKYQGQTYRKLNKAKIPNVDDFINNHKVGGLVRYSNFTSTSINNSFADEADILLKINSKSGVDIQHLSQFSNETEVLMPRQAVYRVLNRYIQDDSIVIELEEILDWADNKQIVQLSLLE